jgi:outer membrane biosynthesis protein TonB
MWMSNRRWKDWRGCEVAQFHMNIWRQFAATVLGLSLLLSVACKKKKPLLPPQAQAPTVSVPVDTEISQAPPAAPPEPQQQANVTPAPEKPKTPPRHRKKPSAQPPPSAPESAPANPPSNPGNTTVAVSHPPPNPAGGAPDTAIAADASSQQVNVQKQNTTELLAAAEKNLQSVNHTLSHDEKAMVAQIKTYIEQSRKATSDKDFERAYNLATKARLLSDALVKK